MGKDVTSANKIAKNSGWLIFEKIYRGVLGIFVGALVARYLEPEGYGTLALGLAIVGILAMVARFGMEQVVVLHVASHKWNQRGVLARAWSASTAIGVLCFIALLSSAWALRDRNLQIVTIVLGVGLIDQVGATYRLAFQALLETRKIIIMEIALATLFAGAQWLLVISRAELVGFAVVILASQLFASVATFVLFRSSLDFGGSANLPTPTRVSLLRTAWPIFTAGIVAYLYTHMDRIMLGGLSGMKEVGLYAVASRIFEFAFFVPTALIHSLVPRIAGEVRDYGCLRKDSFLLFGASLSLISAGLTVSLVATSWIIIHFLYGVAYAGSAIVLSLLSVGLVPVALGRLRNATWVAEGKQSRLLYMNLCGLMSNALLNYLLIPMFGASGAAAATVVSMGIAFWFAGYVSGSTRSMACMQTQSFVRILKPTYAWSLITGFASAFRK